MQTRIVLAVAVLVAVAPARPDVTPRAMLHLRVAGTDGLPDGTLRYDEASRAFAVANYLAPAGRETHASSFASVALDGTHRRGDLRWSVALDSGEVRRTRAPNLVPVCFARGETGLAAPGSGECRLFPSETGLRRVVVPVESTALGSAELTSNGRAFRDEADSTAFVREAWVAASFGRAGFATVRAGRRRLAVADGLVYDDYATGVEVALDVAAIGPRCAFSSAAFEPGRDLPRGAGDASPMVFLRADFLPSLFEHAGFFVAGYRDRTGSLGEILRGAIEERVATELLRDPPEEQAADAQLLALVQGAPSEGEARLGWVGTTGNLVPLRGHRLRWAAALLGGSVDEVQAGIRPDPAQPPVLVADDLRLAGRAVQVRWDADVGRRVTAAASFLYLSGDELPRRGAASSGGVRPPLSGHFGGFVGVRPFVTATNLFFGGGLSENFAARQASVYGVNGRGVIAPGVALGWDPTDHLALDLGATWLRADAAGPFGGRNYGTEVDIEARWQLTPWLQLGAELDALVLGDFFPSGRVATRTILAVDVFTP